MRRLAVAALRSLVILAVVGRWPAWADAVYHEQTSNDATGGAAATGCAGPQAYVETPAPDSTQGYTLRFRVGYTASRDHSAVYYTTNGARPAGSRGSGSAGTLVVAANRICTLTNSPETVDIRIAALPAQPPGTTVKYIVSGWDSGGGDEIFGNSTTCEDCLAFTNASQATLFQYAVVGFPAISVQPQSRTNSAGSEATFVVNASGAEPLSYQWYRQETNALAGGTNATLLLAHVQPVDAGPYRVVVSNAFGAVTSDWASLTVQVIPSILQQPVSLTVPQGHPAAFTVVAVGDLPLTYQWWLGGTMLAGQTNDTLALPSAQPGDAGPYQVVISNAAGSVTSAVATLTVQAMDFGDAPPGYPTLLTDDGARHVISPQFYLGSRVDAEPDGQPSASAFGDDFGGVSDEDGISFSTPVQIGQTTTVLVLASTNGFLQGWLDFNGDFDWNDAGEQIFTNRPVVPGTNRLSFLVPAGATPGITFARFRFSSAAGLSFVGPAPDGEVEDYAVALQPTVDLGVALSDLPDPVQTGANLTYLLVVTNRGPSTATGVALTDVLSDRVQFRSAIASQGGCSNANGTVTCALGSLGAGRGATVTIVVRAAAPGTFANTATVAGAEFDLNPADNTATQTTVSLLPAQTFANATSLVLDTILSGPASLYPSSIDVSGFTAAVYRVTVTLNGLSHTFPDDLDILLVAPGGRMAILMSDAGANFPADNLTLTFDDAAAVAVPNSGQLVSGTFQPANYGSLPDPFPEPAPAGPYPATLATFNGINPNGTWSLYVVDDTSEDGGEIAGGWSLSITTSEPIADLSITQVVTPNPGAVGTNLLYTMTVTNQGPADASAVTLADRLPSGLDFISVTASRGSCSNENGAITCGFGVMTSGAGATVSLVVRPALGARFTNTVVVSARESDQNPTNNTATTVNAVPEVADLGVAVSGAPEPVLVGGTLTYSIQVTNQGPNVATGVVLSDTLPAGIRFISALPSQGACSNLADSVACALGSLPSKGSASVAITCRPSEVGRVTNTVHVAGDPSDPRPNDNAAQVASTVDPAADVTLSMGASLQTVGLAQPLRYTMVLSNQGPNDASRLTLQDLLPAQVTFVAVNSSQGFCTNANGLVACEIGHLAPGQTATVSLTVTPISLGSFTNTASLLTEPADPNPANNVALIAATAVPAAELSVAQNDSPDPAWRLETVTYTLSVTNAGPSDATGVVLRDTLPGSVVPSSIISSQGSCTNQAGIITCNLGILGNGRQATVTVVVSPTRAGILTNQLLASANELDIDPTNNHSLQLTTVVMPGGIFTDAAPVTIPSLGAATPYPSTLTVLGMTAAVQQVRVTLTNLSHSYPDDLDILLVGPNGRTVVLMSDAGGEAPLSNATLRFDDQAPPLPDSGPIVSGSFRPTDYEATDLFPAPAPPGPHGTNLSVFEGMDPNGTWSLYVVDDAAKDSGTLGGWRLDIAVRDPIADLLISGVSLPEAVAISSNLVFTVGVSNRGPAQATQVRLTDQLPAALHVLSATPSQGSCTNEGGILRCDLGSLPSRSNAVVVVSAVPTNAATSTNVIAATAQELDLVPSNNTFESTITFEYAPLITLQPRSFSVTNGESVVFTAEVTGTGPLAYQWQRNGLDLPGATNTSLALDNVSPLQAGQFRLQVTNRVGTTLSDVATLRVLGPPGISDLSDQTIDEDTSTGLIPFLIADSESPPETLQVSGSSSNPGLLPDANIFFSGTDSNRFMRLVPLPNQFGDAVVSVRVTDPDNFVTIASFRLTVRPVNDPPVIGPIPAQTTLEDTPLVLTFAVDDPDLPLDTLSVSGSASDPTLVPAAGIVVTGAGNVRTLTVTPAQDRSGNATVTLTVTDAGGASATTQFALTVVPVNDPPKLAPISNLVIDEDSGPRTVPLEGINSGAADEFQHLRVTATSSDLSLIPNPTIAYTSPEPTGTLTFVPRTNAHGTATITVTVNDGQGSNNAFGQSFTVEIKPVNDPPSISGIPDQVTREDTALSLPLAIADDDTPADSLALAATSSNPGLLPATAFVFGGAGANRTLTITPATNQFGTSSVTVSVTDTNGASASTHFVLTVEPVNDPPTLDPLSDRVINEDAGQQTVNLTGIGPGATNEIQDLTVTANSDNPGLIPDPAVTYTSPAGAGTLRFTPLPNATGNALITVTVHDGQATNSATVRAFTVTVNAINDAPVLSPVASLSTPEDTPVTIPVTIGDPDNPVFLLGLTGSSSNTNLVPNGNLFMDGAASNRSVTIVPASNQTGTATITLNLTDGSTNATRTFVLTVTPVNDWPTLADLPDTTVDEGAGQFTVPFTGVTSGATNETQTLSVTAVSSNSPLVTVQSVTYTSPASTGSLRLRASGAGTGTALIAVTVSDGGTSNNLVTRTFTVFVKPATNTVPVISGVADRATPEDTPTGPIAFTVTDAQTPAASLAVTAHSSNPALVPDQNISLGGSGSNRTVSVTPAPNQTGTATITLSVVDTAFGATADSFVLTVNPVNDPPSISGLADQVVSEDSPPLAVPFTLSDVDNPAADLTVTPHSSNAALIPDSNLRLGGSGTNRALLMTVAAHEAGSTTISLMASDGQTTSSNGFILTVTAVNDPPSLSTIPDQATTEDNPAPPIAFVIGDLESAADTLTVTGASSNLALVPPENLLFGGSGSNRTLQIVPAPNEFGTATITVTVADGSGATVSHGFRLSVTPENDPPTLDPIAPIILDPDAGPQTVVLTGISAGPANESQTVALTATSSDPSLVPDPAVSYTSPDTTGTLSFTPITGAHGTARVTVTVNDGQVTSNLFTRTFEIRILQAPTLSEIPDQATFEDTPVGPIAFLVGDAETPADALVVTGGSSNTNLVPEANLFFSGSGSNRTLTIYPATNGWSFDPVTITVSVTDERGTTTRTSFELLVIFVNDPPLVSPLDDQTILEDSILSPLPFTAWDPDLHGIELTARSSNTNLVPDASLEILSGLGLSYFLVARPAADESGSTTISVVATDVFGATTEQQFTLAVLPVNDPPTLDPLPNLSLALNASTQTVVLSGISAGPLNERQGLTVTAVSSDPALVPHPTVDYTSPNAVGTLKLYPARNAAGAAQITVSVQDDGDTLNGGQNAFTRTFTVAIGQTNRSVLTVGRGEGQVNLSFETMLGASYTVQYKNSVTETNWSPLVTRPGTGATVTVSDLVVPGSHRFYRLRVDTLPIGPSEPSVLTVARADGQVALSFKTETGFLYTLQYRNAVTDIGWNPLTTRSGTGTTVTVSDPIVPGSQRFYRLRVDTN